MLQLFQWGRTLRELWIDGRKLPSGDALDSLGPSWFGISVAHWEGNTLVVESTGFDERAWPDQYGHPLSFDAKITERYTRVGPDTIDGTMTIDDPKNYTGPWPYRGRDEDAARTPFPANGARGRKLLWMEGHVLRNHRSDVRPDERSERLQ